MVKIMFILGSSREGRNGDKVAKWVMSHASKKKEFASEFIDLKEMNFNFLSESTPPIMGQYQSEKTKKWAAKVAESDGFVWISPEYNHGYPAVMKNALDLIYKEWNNKPVAIVSYGGAAGGIRCAEQLRLVAIELQMAPIREQVFIPEVWAAFDESGRLNEEQKQASQLEKVFEQLLWWTNALKKSRA